MRARLSVLVRPQAAVVVPWLLIVVVACHDAGSPQACQDADHDGRGVGCAAGPDCDDADPNSATLCGADAGALACDSDPLTSGCPCLRGDRQLCFGAPAESLGVGPCRGGTTQCRDGVWADCDGAILPTYETCNSVDDDCDGVVDEGVQSPCGGCNPDCAGGVWGPPATPFEPDAMLDVTDAGELTLRREQRSALTLWVPNSDEGTVSKIDAASAQELARYRTFGGNPIRVAVDHRGDVWVLDGSLLGRAHLTKIAGDRARCRDRNADGVSTGQGPNDVRALGDDECVLLDLPLGAAGDDARALALDGSVAPDSGRVGNVWVGMAGSQRLLTLDGQTGALIAQYELPGFSAYAGVFDAWGVLWLIARDGWLERIDPAHPSAANRLEVPFGCYALEGLSIDPEGRLMLTGFGCESVMSYDPRRNAWRQAQVPALLSPRGIVAMGNSNWVAYTSGQIARLAREPLTLNAARSLAQGKIVPFETVALAADSRGQLWAISTQGGPDGRGLATCFDPASNAVVAQVPVGVGPRGSGDLTGFATAFEFVREGVATHLFRGCGHDDHEQTAPQQIATAWQNVHVASVLGAGASVEVAVRHAEAEETLATRSFTVLGSVPEAASPFPLALPVGGVVEVRLTLRSLGAIGAPRVTRVGVEWRCPGPD